MSFTVAGTPKMEGDELHLGLHCQPPLYMRFETRSQPFWFGAAQFDVKAVLPVLNLDVDQLWLNSIKPRVEAEAKGWMREQRDNFEMWQVEAEKRMCKTVIEALEVLVERDPAKVEELLKAAKAARELREQNLTGQDVQARSP